MDATELAWAAGFLDGEGCFSISSDGTAASISAGQVARAPLEKLKAMFGGGVSKPKSNGVSQWVVKGYGAAEVASAVRPYLTVKGEHADLIISWASVRKQRSPVPIEQAERVRRLELARKISRLNRSRAD